MRARGQITPKTSFAGIASKPRTIATKPSVLSLASPISFSKSNCLNKWFIRLRHIGNISV
jgi:hypothetical protein